jgi:hypothetical protein
MRATSGWLSERVTTSERLSVTHARPYDFVAALAASDILSECVLCSEVAAKFDARTVSLLDRALLCIISLSKEFKAGEKMR